MTTKYKDQRSKLLKDPEYYLESVKGEFITDITETICKILEDKNIERQGLASKMKKTKGYISQILNGNRNMTLNTLAEIAVVLGYTPKIIFEEKGVEEKSVLSMEINMDQEETVYYSKVA